MVGVLATPTIPLPYSYRRNDSSFACFTLLNFQKKVVSGDRQEKSKVNIFRDFRLILSYWFERTGSEGVFTGRPASKIYLP